MKTSRAVLFALLTTVCVVVFTQLTMPLSFVILPILLIIAVRFRILGVTAALVIISILAVGGAMMGAGPYPAVISGPGRALMAQLLVLFGYMPVLLVAALVVVFLLLWLFLNFPIFFSMNVNWELPHRLKCWPHYRSE